MFGFWVVTGAISLAVLGLCVLALQRSRGTDADAQDDREMRVYRDQLNEIERDLMRGVIGRDEAARLRTEVSRRLLDADRVRTRATGRGPSPLTMRRVALAALAGVLLVAVLTYGRVGAPGYGDQPLAQRIDKAADLRMNRPDQAEMEALMAQRRPATTDPERAEHEALVAQLRVALQDRPQDLQGHMLLAHNEALLGNFSAAAAAQSRVIDIRGDAVSADELAVLAEYLIFAAGGAVSPQAEAVLEKVLRRDPRHGAALYYTGVLFAQTGREDHTFNIWRRLHDMSPGDAPWMDEIRAALPGLAEAAGVRFTLPPRPPARDQLAPDAGPGSGPVSGQMPGPTPEQIEAAAALSDEERAAMIEGMVAQLMNRMATEGGGPEDWARLIAVLGVLGQTERAALIWEEAQAVFGAFPEALAPIRAAAESAGVAR